MTGLVDLRRTTGSAKAIAAAAASNPSIALFFYRLGDAGGGAERMICALATELCARGYDVHLVSWDQPSARTFYYLDPAIRWHRLGFQIGLIDKLRRARALFRVLRRERVQVLVGFVMSGDKTVYAAARLAGVRIVVAERNAPTMYHIRYGPLQRALSFGMLHLADRITVQMGEFASGYPPSLRARIVVIPNPVSQPERRAQPDQPGANGRFTLLAVGRLDPVQKRLVCLVNAFARVSAEHPSWDLEIVGDGQDEASLRRAAKNHGIASRFRLQSTSPDIFVAYARSHLFAIPSRWEGFPNALAEAMSHGLPAVGFRGAAGVAQLIADGETGWLADGPDAEASLAKALGLAVSDGPERSRRGALAAEAMKVYAPDKQFDRWGELIDSLLKGAR